MEFVNFAIGLRGFPKCRTKLDGVFFQLEAVWNNIEQRWSLNIYQADGTALLAGLAMRHGEDLLAPFRDAALPGAGLAKLRPWDTTGRGQDPGRRDLARTSSVRLVYIPAAEATQ